MADPFEPPPQPPQPRRRLQIHLSTCVLLTFVAAGFGLAIFLAPAVQHQRLPQLGYTEVKPDGSRVWIGQPEVVEHVRVFGLPAAAWREIQQDIDGVPAPLVRTWLPRGIAIDAGALAFALLLAALASETWIRHRATRKNTAP